MEAIERKSEFYRALIEKNSEYEGIFYVGVKTTGVFCRPTCPARKPKFENCEFYFTAKEALLASFRPCKRCRPLSHPNQVSEVVTRLVEAVEESPEKQWKSYHFKEMSIDESTARRQFKKRFGMTFVEYARSRRMGIAMKQIRSGDPVIEAQLAAGYESGSGFRDAFSRIMGAPPALAEETKILKASWIDTKLGSMLAIADDDALWLLEFVDRRGLEREVEKLRTKTKSAVIPGTNQILQSIEKELQVYFAGKLTEFKTPVHLLGSDFQKSVWEKLREIQYGETQSYFDIAAALEKPTAFRAVALANGANQLAIIIPCHRVIRLNGELGGYGGGISRKQWMLEFEKKNK
ncbi:trifunctional transcriptional activator/DNA repair protein Ada/methylated-DNA--[protein]-cysteine S-methyltransferase [Jeotgalibacillus sp. ET6]|uniref:bifunctional transcriptional activator/DNA repair enzyme AdaA n=1 Tax=Jeotgalibacillus sp. ET6 TaxID=3037260 RepID=UPI0024188A72|nr:trifunctional transcriptional activator/DNA repair protein Ada/methylated-DNA--[protein]-cysteine S-methyltransferase [Jeotgalibacillus sp. ET6]MDG5471999.1 trifunctional transcriptional activator/DNA repair protein Ada/methylated-DNA--[protein]-cysteine S-methyltransferase [Jeotgalibacillus sp. ET6]